MLERASLPRKLAVITGGEDGAGAATCFLASRSTLPSTSFSCSATGSSLSRQRSILLTCGTNQRWERRRCSVCYTAAQHSTAQHAATHLLNGESEVGRLVARGPHTAHDAFVINACSPSYQQQRKRDRMHAPASKLYPLTSSCDDSASVLRPSTALHQRQQWQARMRRSRGSLRGGNCGNLISGCRHLISLRSGMKGDVFSWRCRGHAAHGGEARAKKAKNTPY